MKCLACGVEKDQTVLEKYQDHHSDHSHDDDDHHHHAVCTSARAAPYAVVAKPNNRIASCQPFELRALSYRAAHFPTSVAFREGRKCI